MWTEYEEHDIAVEDELTNIAEARDRDTCYFTDEAGDEDAECAVHHSYESSHGVCLYAALSASALGTSAPPLKEMLDEDDEEE